MSERRMPVSSLPAALLLLVDSRLPAGGHAHSGGLETAVALGAVDDVASLGAFLQGRLWSSGAVSAAFAAASARTVSAGGRRELQAELDARMPSAPVRAASRALGRSLLRVVARAWPHPAYATLGPQPHHALVLGVAVAAAGGSPHDAAVAAATAAVTGPASAAVRLLALDPIEVTELLARLSPQIDAVAVEAAHDRRPDELAAWSMPALDAYAELHATAEVKLFAS